MSILDINLTTPFNDSDREEGEIPLYNLEFVLTDENSGFTITVPFYGAGLLKVVNWKNLIQSIRNREDKKMEHLSGNNMVLLKYDGKYIIFTQPLKGYSENISVIDVRLDVRQYGEIFCDKLERIINTDIFSKYF